MNTATLNALPYPRFVVARGRGAGTVLVPHVHDDGMYVVSPSRFEKDYVRTPSLAEAIRYVKEKRQSGGGEEQLTHWIATIQYAYGEPSKDAKTRRWNPLGFKIIDFKPEAEVITQPADSAAGVDAAVSMSRTRNP